MDIFDKVLKVHTQWLTWCEGHRARVLWTFPFGLLCCSYFLLYLMVTGQHWSVDD